jgi:hypothetical protein
MRLHLLAFAAVLAASAPAAASFHDVVFDPVDFDRWLYPFNGTPGIRPFASTFSAVESAPDFDNKDAQFVIWVDTEAAGIPAGLGTDHYHAITVRVTATHFQGNFLYDPSYDAWQTYLPPADPLHVPDSDPGRPIEIYGVGTRNGYALARLASGTAGPPLFEENERHCEFCSFGQALRNIFAYDPGAADPEGDVSNNVVRLAPLTGGGFDPFPWAIGTSTSGLTPGAAVPNGVFDVSPGETFEFEIDTSDPDVLEYVREGLDAGVLGFTIVSMHDVEQMVGGTNPSFYTSEAFDTAAVEPTIEVVTVVPEPGLTASVAACGAALALLDRRRSARRRARA